MPTRPKQHRPAGWKPAPPKKREAFYGTAAWRKKAKAVIARDGGLCRVCGRLGADTAHHLVERKHQGSDDDHNLVAVHGRCHHMLHPEKGRRA